MAKLEMYNAKICRLKKQLSYLFFITNVNNHLVKPHLYLVGIFLMPP